MRFILLQNGLKDRRGHFLAETLGWLKASSQRGFRVSVYTHKEADPTVILETEGIPAFSFMPGQFNFSEGNIPLRDAFALHATAYANTLVDLSPNIGADDVVVVPYATDCEVYGIGQWLQSVPKDDRPRVAFIFHVPDMRWKIDGKSKQLHGDISSFRNAFEHLKGSSSPERMLYFATNKALSSLLTEILGVPFSVCPVPISYSEDESFDERTAVGGERAHIGIVGELRQEKGSLLVADILEQFNHARPGKSVFVQTNFSRQGSVPGLDKLHSLQNNSFTLFDGEMTKAAYAQRLKNIDIFLLPYLRQRYAFRISAVFADAVAYGAVTVVPSHTWMAQQLELGFGAGVVFGKTEPSEICRALISASDSFGELQKKARRCADEWRRTQCTDALVEHIISHLPS